MNTTEQELKERIKELTCLYEVSSIIVNANVGLIQDTLEAVAFCLKKAFQHPNKTEITITTNEFSFSTNENVEGFLQLKSDLKIFNQKKGEVIAHLEAQELPRKDFLKEEQLLLDNIALKLGSMFERLEIEKNERSLKRQMERVDRLSILGEITAGIAHELNTPLANILGYAELLQEDLKEDQKTANDLDKIVQNAIFTREVVKKLMFFACEMPQQMKRVNIIPNIINAINLLEASFRKKQVKYLVKIEAEELWLRADPIQVTQIIFNLLINAIYFSPKNGLVEIEAYQSEKDIVLRISDQGQGFTPDALTKIFQPFFSTKPIGEGSGLGLSVVHGIITSHKGSIVAENNTKNGATFTVSLPKD